MKDLLSGLALLAIGFMLGACFVYVMWSLTYRPPG